MIPRTLLLFAMAAFTLAGPAFDVASIKPSDRGSPAPDPTLDLIFTALTEQLGLKLQSGKGPVEVYVIDHAEKPSED